MNLPTGSWTLDPSATKVSFTVKNWLVKTVQGSFSVLAGSAEVADDPAQNSLEVIFDTTSFDTGNGKRDHHVKSDDFLAADRHPQGTFTSSTVTQTPDGYRVSGELSVGPGTAPVDFVVVLDEVTDDRAVFQASAAVERRSLGVDRLPNFTVSNDVAITVQGIAERN
jgi:polyisoprenoid-binding protein YceI